MVGTWGLVAWRRIAGDGTESFPLGEDAVGLLIYTADGRMSVQLAARTRPKISTDDPLGGDVLLRAEGYSTYLAYYGTYELRDDSIVHQIDASLFPAWSGEEQMRHFTYDGDTLVLRTPPMEVAVGPTVINELAWVRHASSPGAVASPQTAQGHQ